MLKNVCYVYKIFPEQKFHLSRIDSSNIYKMAQESQNTFTRKCFTKFCVDFVTIFI